MINNADHITSELVNENETLFGGEVECLQKRDFCRQITAIRVRMYVGFSVHVHEGSCGC